MVTTVRTEDDRNRLIEHIRGRSIKRPLIVTVETKKKRRSLPQNRLLHMWISIISEDTGNSKKALYAYYCEEFLPFNKELVFGNEVRKDCGSSELTTEEFTKFLDEIRVHASEQGIFLPLPGEVEYDEMVDTYSKSKVQF